MNSGNKDSCQDIFKKITYSPLLSQYIFSLLMFVAKNRDLFKTNSDIHSFNTRSHDLHIPAANLAVFQKGVCYSGIKFYNHLPPTLKQLSYYITKFNPLPSLMLRSARNLNVPCWPKCSKALLLSTSKIYCVV